MLRDGQFVREEPPKIGSQYVPNTAGVPPTKEEQFMQNILLGVHYDKQSFLSKVLGIMMRV